MKKIILLAFLFWSAFSVYSQVMLSSGSQIIISDGSVVVTNNITTEGGTIKNLGQITVLGDITNNSGDLFDALSVGTISFKGSSAQEISGTSSSVLKGTVIIDNADGVQLAQSQSIPDNLSFVSGKLTLNTFNLSIGSTNPTGASTTSYIVTNSSGVVKRSVPADGSTEVEFPVGISTYNPITLQNSVSAITDTYSIGVVDTKPSLFSGTTHIVNRSWVISEESSGNSDLTIKTQWNADDELGTFDETRSCIGVTIDDGENVSWGPGGAAVGNPYTRNITGVSSLGKIMITDYFYGGLVVDFKVILAAAWNTTNSNMDKTLNTLNLIPLTDPYGLETTVSAIPEEAVDWVKIEFRDVDDNTLEKAFARLIDQDGQIIEPDVSNFKIKEVESGSYSVVIKHRNHLGIVSNNPVDLSVSSPAVNFKNSQSVAWQNGTISTNAAMKDVGGGVFALWQGNASGDGNIVYNGGDSDRVLILDAVGGVGNMSTVISNIYSALDINMDGKVVYNGGDSDRVLILDNVGGVGNMSTVLTAHLH